MDDGGSSQDQSAKKSGDDGKPAAGVPWIRDMQVLLAILAGIGTALGAWGTYQSTQNKGRIDDLTAQIQATQQFSAGIHDARDVLTNDRHVKAMVELSRLYALARTPQQKLVLIQVAQMSQQWQGLEAMATLIGNDDQMQPTSDSNRQVLASIGRIIANAQTQIAQSGTADAAAAAAEARAPVTPRPQLTPHKRTTGKPGHVPRQVIVMAAPPPPRKTGTTADALARSADPPLTQSKDSSVAASAALIAALPKTTKQQGWIFLGDADGEDTAANAPDAPLLPQSASTSAHAVPPAGSQIVACQDINLREVPHGRVVTIVSRGNAMQVLQSDSHVTKSFGAISVWTHRPITARWAFVEIEEGGPGKTTGCGG